MAILDKDKAQTQCLKSSVLDFLKLSKQVKKKGMKELLSTYVLTLVAEMLLAKKFGSKRDEWKMIGRKTTKWLQQATATLDSSFAQGGQGLDKLN